MWKEARETSAIQAKMRLFKITGKRPFVGLLHTAYEAIFSLMENNTN